MTTQSIQFVLLLLIFLLKQAIRGVVISGCIANERNALLNFKKSLVDKNSRLASWNGNNYCSWKGVSCNNLTGHVIRLDLRNPRPFSEFDDVLYNEWSLGGQLSPSLLDLKQLNYLDLSMNHFDGSIPKFLGSLHNLGYLNLSLTGFHGLIPHHLGNLSRLEYLDLNFGRRYGDSSKVIIDDSYWISHLVSLKHLTMKNAIFTSLQKSVEALNILPNIVELCLSNCIISDFSVSFPYVNFTNLSYLDISDNSIDLKALEELLLSENKLNGTVPRSIGQLSNLLLLHLEENYLEGIISEVHYTRLVKLKELKLDSNNLIMNVSHDWIPPFKLEVIGIGSSKIGPYFPQWLVTQVNLSFLNLSSSDIMDNLPDWFWGVFGAHDMITLDLSNNVIKGNLRPLPKLNFYLFDVSNNSLSGSIQPILSNRTMSYIYLSRNKFSGEIPLSVCSTKMRRIDLSRNLLTGELPNCWDQLLNSSLGHLHLDFSRNNLYGNIPHSLGALMSPTSMRLRSLHLSYNKLSGNLPINLRNCVALITLDLSMNNLTGIIPTWIGEDLIILKVLDLRSNNFMGNVPSNLSKLKELRVLVLANNKLTGRIPPSFGNFSVMMVMHPTKETDFLSSFDVIESPNHMDYVQLTIKKRDWNYDRLLTQITTIDLSLNNLSEQIPKELGNLHGLNSLNLSGNHLVGPIPNAIGLMNSLESLDLSRNELSGNIPSTMSNMTVLNSLNLSYNNLFGKIPSGNQLQTFTNESYTVRV